MFNDQITNIILQAFYYIPVVIIVFLAAFSVYVLISYGRSRLFSIFLSLAFIFIFLTALSQSFNGLQSLLS